MKTALPLASVLGLLFTTALAAQTHVGWRGDGTGVYPDANGPRKWSTQENIVWATPLAGRSNAQPVPVDDKIFVCAEPFTLLCLRARDGHILWQRSNSYREITTPAEWDEIERELALAKPLQSRRQALLDEIEELQKAEGDEQEAAEKTIAAHRQRIEQLDQELEPLSLAARFTLPATQPQYNGYTTATPTSDGRHVWAVFGNRAVVCYDLQGNLEWARVLPDNPQSMWGHSSSPLLVGRRLVVNIEHTVAFDAQTGEQLWRTKYGQSWGSAVQAQVGDETLILLANGRWLRAADGQVLARVAPLGNASPVVHGRTAYYVGFEAVALDLPKQLQEPFPLRERWVTNPKDRQFFASPIVHQGLVYAVSTRHVLTVIDGANGEIVYAQRLVLGPGPVWASLCVAGDYLYISSRDGTTLVLKTGRQYEEVARNTLDYFIATPVFDGDRMYVRTSEHLYCISES